MLLERFLNCCWRENPKLLLFYCETLPVLYAVDQRRILFHGTPKHHRSILTRAIAKRDFIHDLLFLPISTMESRVS